MSSHSCFTGQHVIYSCGKISSKHEELQRPMFSGYQVLIKKSKWTEVSAGSLPHDGNLYRSPGVFNFEIPVVGRSWDLPKNLWMKQLHKKFCNPCIRAACFFFHICNEISMKDIVINDCKSERDPELLHQTPRFGVTQIHGQGDMRKM